ncbi:hypothetical protein ARMGADRAFT_79525 [Armillaria gallica]|uniref:Uncharacterized protein n=1 Tax=Armillaria gallica TaxID=47427 RepID=A0A2H3CB79_ARMGA|nr:hypothetical protein ARMGADRAFT_79525 [Armillaria gallica]
MISISSLHLSMKTLLKSLRTPVEEYLDNLSKNKFVLFYVQFIHERESVLNHLKTYYPPDTVTWANDLKQNDTYINEHNKLVVASISHTYSLGVHWLPVLPSSTTMEIENFELRDSPSLTSLTNSGWSGLEKPHILSVYTMFYYHCHTRTESKGEQCYAPGSILTLDGKTLVGRARDSLGTWIVDWHTGIDALHYGHYIFALGSITIFPACSLAYSWIAQASQLYSFLHSEDCIVDDDLYMMDGYWILQVKPK